jgi:hypothetical protein
MAKPTRTNQMTKPIKAKPETPPPPKRKKEKQS